MEFEVVHYIIDVSSIWLVVMLHNKHWYWPIIHHVCCLCRTLAVTSLTFVWPCTKILFLLLLKENVKQFFSTWPYKLTNFFFYHLLFLMGLFWVTLFFSSYSVKKRWYIFNCIFLFIQDWDRQNATQIMTEMCGFVTILSGTFLLHKTKDMVEGGVSDAFFHSLYFSQFNFLTLD